MTDEQWNEFVEDMKGNDREVKNMTTLVMEKKKPTETVNPPDHYQADAINQAVKHAVYYGMLLEALHHKTFSRT